MIAKIIGLASSNEQIASDHWCFQNTMNEMQQMMQPMMQRIGRMQQEVCSGNPSGKEGERRLMGPR